MRLTKNALSCQCVMSDEWHVWHFMSKQNVSLANFARTIGWMWRKTKKRHSLNIWKKTLTVRTSLTYRSNRASFSRTSRRRRPWTPCRDKWCSRWDRWPASWKSAPPAAWLWWRPRGRSPRNGDRRSRFWWHKTSCRCWCEGHERKFAFPGGVCVSQSSW